MVSEKLPPPCSVLYLGPAVMGTLLWNHFTLTSAGVTAHLKMASLPSVAATLFSLVVNRTSLGAERYRVYIKVSIKYCFFFHYVQSVTF